MPSQYLPWRFRGLVPYRSDNLAFARLEGIQRSVTRFRWRSNRFVHSNQVVVFHRAFTSLRKIHLTIISIQFVISRDKLRNPLHWTRNHFVSYQVINRCYTAPVLSYEKRTGWLVLIHDPCPPSSFQVHASAAPFLTRRLPQGLVAVDSKVLGIQNTFHFDCE